MDVLITTPFWPAYVTKEVIDLRLPLPAIASSSPSKPAKRPQPAPARRVSSYRTDHGHVARAPRTSAVKKITASGRGALV